MRCTATGPPSSWRRNWRAWRLRIWRPSSGPPGRCRAPPVNSSNSRPGAVLDRGHTDRRPSQRAWAERARRLQLVGSRARRRATAAAAGARPARGAGAGSGCWGRLRQCPPSHRVAPAMTPDAPEDDRTVIRPPGQTAMPQQTAFQATEWSGGPGAAAMDKAQSAAPPQHTRHGQWSAAGTRLGEFEITRWWARAALVWCIQRTTIRCSAAWRSRNTLPSSLAARAGGSQVQVKSGRHPRDLRGRPQELHQ